MAGSSRPDNPSAKTSATANDAAAQETAAESPRGRKMGPFLLQEQLGVGGMGVVYKAVYVVNGKHVAVKLLTPGTNSNPQVLARFEREMAILKRLRDPHIVQYFGGGKSGGQTFYAMEYMPGGSVEDRLKKQGPLPWEEAIDLLRQVAQGLEHAHNAGIIHRDLKPANLFLAGSGRVKLGDFGIARDTEATALTAAGKTVGTYAYMAPEQIVGKPPIGRRTDLYALGCVAFELLTGRPPFKAETPAQMLFMHLNDPPPRVRDFDMGCPIWLDQFVLKCLAKDPEQRYFDALAVQVALDEVKEKVANQESFVQNSLAGTAVPGATAGVESTQGREVRELLGKKRKRKRKAGPFYEQVWFLSLCLLLIAGGVTWAMWPPSEAELYADAAALWNPADMPASQEARRPLQTLLERFPTGPHAVETQQRLDLLAMDLLERQATTKLRLGAEPDTAAERVFMRAMKTERDDRIAAIVQYQSLDQLFADDPAAKLYARLARQRAKKLEASIRFDERLPLVERALFEADQNFAVGRLAESRDIWNSLVALFGDTAELEPQVRYAQARLRGETPPPLEFSSLKKAP